MLNYPFDEDTKTILNEAGFIVQPRQAHLIGPFQKNSQDGDVQFVCSVQIGSDSIFAGRLSRKYKGAYASNTVAETKDRDIHFLIAQLLEWKLVEETKVLLTS
jgi:hypothetical protein